MGIYLTKKELATVAGYTYRRLHDIDMGLPDDGKLFVKGEGGKYDLALFVQRWVKYNVDNETGDDQTLDEVKARHEIVKTRKTELEVARLEGKLVDVHEIRRLWGRRRQYGDAEHAPIAQQSIAATGDDEGCGNDRQHN